LEIGNTFIGSLNRRTSAKPQRTARGAFLTMRRLLALAALLVVSTVVWTSGVAAGSGREAPTLIACLHEHEFRYFSEPSRCEFFARQYYPDGRLRRFREVGIKHLQWTNWGRRVAVGVGVSVYAYPLRVVASDRVRCPGGRWYYGKVFTHGSVGRDQHLRLARCGASRFPPFNAGNPGGRLRPLVGGGALSKPLPQSYPRRW
jgi:hypothetical protein